MDWRPGLKTRGRLGRTELLKSCVWDRAARMEGRIIFDSKSAYSYSSIEARNVSKGWIGRSWADSVSRDDDIGNVSRRLMDRKMVFGEKFSPGMERNAVWWTEKGRRRMRTFSMSTPRGSISFLIQWSALNHHQTRTTALLNNQVPHLAFPIPNLLSPALYIEATNDSNKYSGRNKQQYTISHKFDTSFNKYSWVKHPIPLFVYVCPLGLANQIMGCSMEKVNQPIRSELFSG